LSRRVGVVSVASVVLLGAVEARAGSGVVSDGSVGFVAGQSIRVHVSNPAPQGAPAPLPVLMRVRVLDTSGGALAVSPLMTVGPGQTRSFSVKRTSLPPQGEPGTGRLQVRTETHLEIPSQPGGHSQIVLTVTELVQEATGRHSGMIGDVRTVISGEAGLQEKRPDEAER
jgi:hypothetical protein